MKESLNHYLDYFEKKMWAGLEELVGKRGSSLSP
jgi:hypothetical protein